ncbi:MAG: hypothetical protein AB7S81_02135 [Bdellovibrionales bacterium]
MASEGRVETTKTLEGVKGEEIPVAEIEARSKICSQLTKAITNKPTIAKSNPALTEAIWDLAVGYGHEPSVRDLVENALQVSPDLASNKVCFSMIDAAQKDPNVRRAKNCCRALSMAMGSQNVSRDWILHQRPYPPFPMTCDKEGQELVEGVWGPRKSPPSLKPGPVRVRTPRSRVSPPPVPLTGPTRSGPRVVSHHRLTC